ncbi:hypothetical protein SCUCBS95973_007471 [Sporothrix curviconia]|uniref:Uncharacterized protein n=1 Tax=Sporothrix curviconia TaxID=1260050 RepID=A0ABP0CDJ0_9PEZI
MASFSRGLMGLATYSFASGMLRSQPAALYGSSSPVLSALRIRLAQPQTCTRIQCFSSSPLVRGKGPQRGKALKNAPSSTSSRTPLRTPRAPSPPRTPAKPRAAPASATVVTRLVSATASATAATAASSAPGSAVSGFAEQLGRRTVSTLLYEAPSHFWFRATTLTAGFLTIAYTVGNYWTVFAYPPENLLWWVPHAFAVICGVMIAGGTYFLMGGLGIIRVIHAIPSARIEAIAGKGAAATAARAVKDAGGGPMPPIFLELEIGRVLPILPARKRYILPENLVVPFRFASYGLSGAMVPVAGAAVTGTAAAATAAATGAAAGAGSGHSNAPLTGYERVKAHEAEQERIAKAREYEMDHLMTAPFRHAGQGAQSFWHQIQRAFSREGFVPVLVNGDRQKLDVTGGWALENGRALDRLVTLKNDIK